MKKVTLLKDKEVRNVVGGGGTPASVGSPDPLATITNLKTGMTIGIGNAGTGMTSMPGNVPSVVPPGNHV